MVGKKKAKECGKIPTREQNVENNSRDDLRLRMFLMKEVEVVHKMISLIIFAG